MAQLDRHAPVLGAFSAEMKSRVMLGVSSLRRMVNWDVCDGFDVVNKTLPSNLTEIQLAMSSNLGCYFIHKLISISKEINCVTKATSRWFCLMTGGEIAKRISENQLTRLISITIIHSVIKNDRNRNRSGMLSSERSASYTRSPNFVLFTCQITEIDKVLGSFGSFSTCFPCCLLCLHRPSKSITWNFPMMEALPG